MLNLSQSYAGNIFQISVVSLFSVYFLRTAKKCDCKWAYIIAYLVRLTLLMFSVYGRNIGLLPFDGDDTEFFYSAITLKKESAYYSRDALFHLTVLLSYVLGDSRLLYQYMMMLISLFGIRMTDKCMMGLSIDMDIRYACLLLISIFPSFSILNVLYLREAIVMTCIVLSFYLFIKFLKSTENKKKAFYFVISFSTIILACPFHGVAIAVAFGYLIAILLYDFNKDRFCLSIKSLIIFLTVFAALMIGCKRFPLFFSKVDTLVHLFKDIGYLGRRFMNESHLGAASDYSKYVGDSETWGRFIVFTPVRMFYGMFSPFPWQWRGLADVAMFFCNSLFYLIVSAIALVNTFRRKYWSNFNRWLFLTLLIISATIGWGCIAFGTAIRHRDKFFPLFLIMLALELKAFRDRNMKKVNH